MPAKPRTPGKKRVAPDRRSSKSSTVDDLSDIDDEKDAEPSKGSENPENPADDLARMIDDESSLPEKVEMSDKLIKNYQGKVVQRRKKNREYDWVNIHKMYVEGITLDDGTLKFPSIAEVADSFSLQPVRIRERSAEEHWVEQRTAYRRRLTDTVAEKRLREMTEESIKFDDKSLSAAKMGIQLTLTRLADIASRVKEYEDRKKLLAQSGLPGDLSDLRSPIYHQEMVNLAQSARVWQEVGKNALGEVTSRTEISGPGGGAIEIEADVRHQMLSDDPVRLAKMLDALGEMGMLSDLPEMDNSNIIDAEEVEDDEELDRELSEDELKELGIATHEETDDE